MKAAFVQVGGTVVAIFTRCRFLSKHLLQISRNRLICAYHLLTKSRESAPIRVSQCPSIRQPPEFRVFFTFIAQQIRHSCAAPRPMYADQSRLSRRQRLRGPGARFPGYRKRGGRAVADSPPGLPGRLSASTPCRPSPTVAGVRGRSAADTRGGEQRFCDMPPPQRQPLAAHWPAHFVSGNSHGPATPRHPARSPA